MFGSERFEKLTDTILRCRVCKHDQTSHEDGTCAAEVDGVRLEKWCNCKEFLKSEYCECGHYDYDHNNGVCGCGCQHFEQSRASMYDQLSAVDLRVICKERDTEIHSLGEEINHLNDRIDDLKLDLARTNLDSDSDPFCSMCDHVQSGHLDGDVRIMCGDVDCTCSGFIAYEKCVYCGHSEHDHSEFICVVKDCDCEDFSDSESESAEYDGPIKEPESIGV